MHCKHFSSGNWSTSWNEFSASSLNNTGNIFLQLARNIVALQVEKLCCRYYHPPQTLSRNKISLLRDNVVTRWVVIRATTLFNLQCNNVSLQVAAICCSYYFTLIVVIIWLFSQLVPERSRTCRSGPLTAVILETK